MEKLGRSAPTSPRRGGTSSSSTPRRPGRRWTSSTPPSGSAPSSTDGSSGCSAPRPEAGRRLMTAGLGVVNLNDQHARQDPRRADAQRHADVRRGVRHDVRRFQRAQMTFDVSSRPTNGLVVVKNSGADASCARPPTSSNGWRGADAAGRTGRQPRQGGAGGSLSAIGPAAVGSSEARPGVRRPLAASTDPVASSALHAALATPRTHLQVSRFAAGHPGDRWWTGRPRRPTSTTEGLRSIGVASAPRLSRPGQKETGLEAVLSRAGEHRLHDSTGVGAAAGPGRSRSVMPPRPRSAGCPRGRRRPGKLLGALRLALDESRGSRPEQFWRGPPATQAEVARGMVGANVSG